MSSVIDITTHSAIRMCERALGIDNPTPKQISHAKVLIEEELAPKLAQLVVLEQGSVLLEEYSVIAIIKNTRVITVKHSETRITGIDRETPEEFKREKTNLSRKAKRKRKKPRLYE